MICLRSTGLIGAERYIGDQARGKIRVLTCHCDDDRILHAGVLQQQRFNLAQLYAHTSRQFDLEIRSS